MRILLVLFGLLSACGDASPSVTAPSASASKQSTPTPITAAQRNPATPPPAPMSLGTVGRWTIEPLTPPGSGPFDYPALAVRDGRIAVALTTLGGGAAYLARREASGWQYEPLAIQNVASLRLAFDRAGALSASARRITLSPMGTEMLSGRPTADGLTFEVRATPCAIAPGSHSLVIGTADRTIQSYSCGDSTVVGERSASGWTTIATLAGLDITDMAIAPDSVIHAAAHVARSPRSEHVTIRNGTVERTPLADVSRAFVEIARDGAIHFVYDRLAPGLSGDHQIRLVTHRGGATTEETIGEGNASAFTLDANDRPVVVSASMLELTTPRVYLRGASAWTSIPFAEQRGDTVIHGAAVDAQRRLHVVYAWTGGDGRAVRYAFVRLPD